MNIKLIPHSVMLLFVCLLAFNIPVQSAHAAPATLKMVSTKAHVQHLQSKLKKVGYFNKDVSGYFETTTLQSLKRFQKDSDSLDGAASKQSSESSESLSKVSISQTELTMLARIIYAEARGESYKGQVAVGAVVMNRLASPSFPNTVRGVIEQPKAFSAVNDGQYRLTPDQTAYQAAEAAVKGDDPTGDALYYFNPQTATSSWIWSRKQTVKIGRHIFAV